MKKNNQKGQVAIFFAVGFVFFIVLLSVIINSSIITAQKIRLQNTADKAAVITASYLGKRIIDTINKYNRYIEDLWRTAQIQLLTPYYYPCFNNPEIMCKTTACNCKTFCKNSDKAVYNKISRIYEAARLPLAQEIRSLMSDGYKYAYQEAVMSVVMDEHSLPIDILNYYKENGGYPGADALIKNYETKNIKFRDKLVSLKDIYYTPEPKKGDGSWIPLFEDNINETKPESRPFIVPVWHYVPCTGCSWLTSDPTQCYIPLMPLPNKKNSLVKILKTTPKEVFYLVMIQYQPLHSFNIFNIKFRNDDSMPTATGKRPYLFADRDVMTAFALAKPDGSVLATDTTENKITDLLNPFKQIEMIYNGATAKMKDFTEARLIGISEANEIGIDLNKSAFTEPLRKELFWH